MKIAKQVIPALAIITITALIGCASKPKVRVVELENKGTSMNIATPDWIKTYTAQGISKVQAAPEFKDKYCVIGEESGVNRQFVLAWADNFSAQQRIGAMLRTTIASEYQARVQGAAQSTGGATASAGLASGEYKQEIDNVINAIVNVSYSGAQREADWWSLLRRYDPDQKDVYRDAYTAYVLYTIPKSQLNQQIARALETSVKADSALYAITIEMAKQILQNGMAQWGVTPTTTAPAPSAPAPSQAQPAAPAAAPAAAATATTATTVYKVGDTGPAGGIIFYDKGNNNGGWRYLEAAPVEAEFQAKWSVHNTMVDNTRPEIGSGSKNTQLIVEKFKQTSGEWDTAAQIVNDLTFGGFSDWFLPTKDELDQMYGNLKRRNLGNFKNEVYWSSSVTDGFYSSYQNFGDGKMDSGWRTNVRFVRPIRQVAGS